MIELKVTVDAPELSVAINHLADAIESKGTDAPAAPVKNSRSKKVAVKTAPDVPAVSAPAHSEPVGSPVPVEQPAAAPQPVQAPAAAPVQQAIPAHSCGRAYDAAACCNCRSRDDPACRSRDPAVYPPARCADTVSAGYHL